MSQQPMPSPTAIHETFHVRSFNATDRPHVQQLCASAPSDFAGCDCVTDVDRIEERYFRRPQDHFWVAEIQGRIVGTAAISVNDENVAHLQYFFALDDSADRHIRRALVQAAANHARRHGSLKLVIHAQVDVQRATEFLHRLGFEFSRARVVQQQPVLEFYLNLYQRPELDAGNATQSSTAGAH